MNHGFGPSVLKACQALIHHARAEVRQPKQHILFHRQRFITTQKPLQQLNHLRAQDRNGFRASVQQRNASSSTQSAPTVFDLPEKPSPFRQTPIPLYDSTGKELTAAQRSRYARKVRQALAHGRRSIRRVQSEDPMPRERKKKSLEVRQVPSGLLGKPLGIPSATPPTRMADGDTLYRRHAKLEKRRLRDMEREEERELVGRAAARENGIARRREAKRLRRKERRSGVGMESLQESKRPIVAEADEMDEVEPVNGVESEARESFEDESHTGQETDRFQSVLDKIEDMPGPSIAESASRSIAVKRQSETQNGSAEIRSKDTTSLAQKQGALDKRLQPGKDSVRPRSGKQVAETEKRKVTSHVKRDSWQLQKNALRQKFGGEGWQPRKRLSPDTLDGIRALHASDPESYTTEVIAKHFKVSAEAIRRILKSKWRPNEHETEERKVRWERRGIKKWQEMADNEGMRPPAKWRALGVTSAARTPEGKPIWTKKRRSHEQDADQSVSEAGRLNNAYSRMSRGGQSKYDAAQGEP